MPFLYQQRRCGFWTSLLPWRFTLTFSMLYYFCNSRASASESEYYFTILYYLRQVSCTPDWHQTHYVAKGNLEPSARTAGVHMALRLCSAATKPRVSRLQSQPSATETQLPGIHLLCYWIQLVNTLLSRLWHWQFLCFGWFGSKGILASYSLWGLCSIKFWVRLWELVLVTGDDLVQRFPSSGTSILPSQCFEL